MRMFSWTLLSFGALVAALLAIWWVARPATPGEFYSMNDHATGAPIILRDKRYSIGVPAGAAARLILYRTTRGDGSAATGTAIVVAPVGAAESPRPVLAWAHGTTGIESGCAPSLSSKPFANMPALDMVLEKGWVIVAPDYVGLGTKGPHTYLVGEDAARAMLDAVRAAATIADLNVSPETVIWGHSQGGHAALFAAKRAKDYAPEISLRGVVAMAPATDLVGLMKRAQSSVFGKIVSSYVIKAFARRYSDVLVEDYVAPFTRLVVGDIASRCVGGWETFVSLGQALMLPSGGILSPIRPKVRWAHVSVRTSRLEPSLRPS